MTLSETLRALPPEQKLAIVTELWDDLARSTPFALPPGEMAEMNRRRDEVLKNPDITIDVVELWRRVNGE